MITGFLICLALGTTVIAAAWSWLTANPDHVGVAVMVTALLVALACLPYLVFEVRHAEEER